MPWFATHNKLPLWERVSLINWGLVLVVFALGMVGVAAMFSVAGGSWEPYAGRHFIRLMVGFGLMFVVAMVDIRFWRDIAWPFYFLVLILLVIVDIKGYIGMGAQRWLDLGVIKLQPSEMAKIAMALVMAAHYAKIPIAEMTRPKNLWQPALAIIVPVALVLGQPDLGTAVKVAMIGIAMAFVAGVSWWLFITCAGILGAALPLIWQYGLHDYQRRRVLTFMDPEADPLGSGYHVMQSKIALGSAGLDGKGFLHGSQSHLEFLPEAHTDFVFSMLAEEWGFLGGVVILSLYFIIFVYSVLIAHRARNTFGRLLAFGLGMNLMFYVMINVGMVMGLLPVVGIPLPLISHGGTVMLSTFFALGLMMSVSVHRDVKLSFW